MFGYLLERLRLGRILSALKRDPDRGPELLTESSVVYRLVLPPEPEILIERSLTDPHPVPLRRGAFEWIGLGLRVYYADSDPWAIPGKPTAYFAFRGPFLVRWDRVDRPIIVGGRRVAAILHDPTFQLPVRNASWYYRRLSLGSPGPRLLLATGPLAQMPPQGGADGLEKDDDTGTGEPACEDEDSDQPPPQPAAQSPPSPLTYPLPPTENDDGTSVEDEAGTQSGSGPTAATADGVACTPLYVAIGLVMQGPDDSPGTGDPHPLRRETLEVLAGLAGRGYGTPNCPAPVAIPAHPRHTPDIDAMISVLATLIPPEFCRCPPDQLVLVVTAHGYGPHLGDNPHNVPAMHYVPGGGRPESWVTHSDFAQKLGTMLGRKGIDPSKVFVILYTCRSGDAFRPGRYGEHMRGSLIVSSVRDADTLSYTNTFMRCLTNCLQDPAVRTWAELMDCVRRCMAPLTRPDGAPIGPPRGGRPQR